jgi:hypothetical protein
MSLFGANGMPVLGAVLCAIFVVLLRRRGDQLTRTQEPRL